MGLSGKSAVVSKNRVGKNLFTSGKSLRKRATQPAESQQENRATNEKIASGAPHYRARYYSPNIGRFLSRDPLENAELTQGPNLYWYVQGNPANKVDHSGRNVLTFSGLQALEQAVRLLFEQCPKLPCQGECQSCCVANTIVGSELITTEIVETSELCIAAAEAPIVLGICLTIVVAANLVMIAVLGSETKKCSDACLKLCPCSGLQPQQLS